MTLATHSFSVSIELIPCSFSLFQEVLELAFSILYESDEYLNFIAPDKHEVKTTPLIMILDVLLLHKFIWSLNDSRILNTGNKPGFGRLPLI